MATLLVLMLSKTSLKHFLMLDVYEAASADDKILLIGILDLALAVLV